ncbi:MAG: prepilin-type N-terminal cleavage/methylation domain-containing protein [Sporichthyaceae bacterium]
MLIKKLRSRGLTGLRKKKDGGFTLVELLVVITILGILAAVVIAAVSGIGDKGEQSARKTDATIQATSMEAYCAKNNTFEDPLILQRDGFLSSQSGYTDVAVDKTQGNCDGRSFEVFVPKTTDYPVTVTGCGGYRTTFANKPARPLVIGADLHEMFVALGIDDSAKVAGPVSNFKVPQDDRARVAANLARNAANPAFAYAATNPANYYLTSASILAQTPQVDFVAASSIRQFTKTGQAIPSPTFVSGFNEQELIDLAPDDVNSSLAGNQPLTTYNGFSWGGCTSDANADGVGQQRSSLEGVFADLRNLGVIFDVQETAAAVISDLRTKLAASLNKAGAGKGMFVSFSSFAGAPGTTHTFGGNHNATGVINLAGGVNPSADQFVFAGRTSSSPLDTLVAARPQVIVITGTQDATTGKIDCNAAYASWKNNTVAAVSQIPAVVNNRVVCTEEGAFYGASISSFHLVDQIATELAQGPEFVRPFDPTATPAQTLPLADPVYAP